MKAALFRELYELAHKDHDTYIIANLRKNPNFENIAHDFSERFIDISTNEHSALTLCQSLIQKGKSAVLCVNTPAFFIRWFEHLLSMLPSFSGKLIIVGIPQAPSPSDLFYHHVRPEILLMHAIPTMVIINPGTSEELGTLLAHAHASSILSYFHFNSLHPSPIIEPSSNGPKLFEPVEYLPGKQALCIGIGESLLKAHQARLYLEEHGYSTALVSIPSIQPLNETALRKYLPSYSAFFVFEETALPLGASTKIAKFFAENHSRKIIFKSFNSSECIDFRTANLDILELMMNSNIIPNNQSWQGK